MAEPHSTSNSLPADAGEQTVTMKNNEEAKSRIQESSAPIPTTTTTTITSATLTPTNDGSHQPVIPQMTIVIEHNNIPVVPLSNSTNPTNNHRKTDSTPKASTPSGDILDAPRTSIDSSRKVSFAQEIRSIEVLPSSRMLNLRKSLSNFAAAIANKNNNNTKKDGAGDDNDDDDDGDGDGDDGNHDENGDMCSEKSITPPPSPTLPTLRKSLDKWKHAIEVNISEDELSVFSGNNRPSIESLRSRHSTSPTLTSEDMKRSGATRRNKFHYHNVMESLTKKADLSLREMDKKFIRKAAKKNLMQQLSVKEQGLLKSHIDAGEIPHQLPEHLQRAAQFIEDYENRKDVSHRLDPISWRLYKYHTNVYRRAFITIVILAFLGTVLFEPPAAISIPEWIPAVVQFVCLGIFTFEVALWFCTVGRAAFFRDPWKVAKIILIILNLAGTIVALAIPSWTNVIRFTRPFFLIEHSARLREFFYYIIRGLWQIFEVVFLILCFVCAYATLGMVLFQSNEEDPSFQHYFMAFMSMFIQLTTVNFPDVMIPAAKKSIWYSIYFMLFHFLCYYMIIILGSAIVVKYFRRAGHKNAVETHRRMRTALLAAFRILDAGEGCKGTISKGAFLSLVRWVRPNSNLRAVEQGFDKEVSSKGRKHRRWILHRMEKDGGTSSDDSHSEHESSFFHTDSDSDTDTDSDTDADSKALSSAATTSPSTKSTPCTPPIPLEQRPQQVAAADVLQFFHLCDVWILSRPKTYDYLRKKNPCCEISFRWLVARFVGSLIRLLNKKKEPGFYRSPAILIARQLLEHRVTNLALQVIIVFNAVVIIANTVLLGENDWNNNQEDKSLLSALSIIDFIFVLIYILELVVKLVVFGLVDYWKSLWNIFDGLVIILGTIIKIISEALLFAMLSQNTVTRSQVTVLQILKLLRMIRIIRFFTVSRRMRYLLATTLELIPTLAYLLSITGSIFYAYAIVGMTAYGDKLVLGNEKLVGTAYHNSNYYVVCTFHNFPRSIITLFHMLIVNNWNVTWSGVYAVSSGWSAIFFISFYFLQIIVLLNIVNAFVLEVFMSKYTNRKRNKESTSSSSSSKRNKLRSKLRRMKQQQQQQQQQQHTATSAAAAAAEQQQMCVVDAKRETAIPNNESLSSLDTASAVSLSHAETQHHELEMKTMVTVEIISSSSASSASSSFDTTRH